MAYFLRVRSGMVRRRMPVGSWEKHELSRFVRDARIADAKAYFEYRRDHSPSFFFSPSSRQEFAQHFSLWDRAKGSPVARADQVIDGMLRFFSHHKLQTGFPPDWHRNAFTGEEAPKDLHWSQIPDFGFGDIKAIWEPSRFSFVFDLVRAFWRTGDERYAEAFWQLAENWRRENPPNRGPNWKCGQEIAFRLMAWCFGLHGFMEASRTTPERVRLLSEMVAASGTRIEGNLDYALSQRNNHGISEATGLFTIGTLFPELKDAERWEKIGREVLEELGLSLIYEDGSFCQHSVNYHRVMLHGYVWALRLGDISGRPFSPGLKARVLKATLFLLAIQDQSSGSVPNYGQNDGALVLALNNCEYMDLRPVIQSAYYLCTGKHCYKPGPWNEDLLWLFGPSALSADQLVPRAEDLRAEDGGYYTLRSEEGFVFTRCATYQDRPGQADMLHTDIWWKGQNVALDAGTFSYNAPGPWADALAGTAVHNTVSVDGLDQMDRCAKFLWFPWIEARAAATKYSEKGSLRFWQGEHNGYKRLNSPGVHRRGILGLPGEHWLILDGLIAKGSREFRLHWLLADYPYEWKEAEKSLTLRTSEGSYFINLGSSEKPCRASLVRASEDSARGWQCPYYYHKEPALSVDMTCRGKSMLFWSFFGPTDCKVKLRGDRMQISGDSLEAEIEITAAGPSALLISYAELKTGIQDVLSVS
jgi:asparagine synthase (glutamine-hydrolysing)